MATISLSPRPVPFTAMSARRGPLANNPNVANSPLRGASVLSGLAKQRRSHATVQREEAYGQPPPVKKQALEDGGHRPVRSPTKIGRLQTQKVSPRGVTRLAPKDRSSKATTDATSTQDAEDERYTELWRKHHMSRFPNMVFYFDSIPDEVRLKLTKKVHSLGSVSYILILRLLHQHMLTAEIFSVKKHSSQLMSPTSLPPGQYLQTNRTRLSTTLESKTRSTLRRKNSSNLGLSILLCSTGVL